MAAETFEAGPMHQSVVEQSDEFFDRVRARFADIETLTCPTLLATHIDVHQLGDALRLVGVGETSDSAGVKVGVGALPNAERLCA